MEIDHKKIAGVTQACSYAKTILRELLDYAQVGVNCLNINIKAKQLFEKLGTESGSFGLYGFPGHIGINVNNEVVHGVPKCKILKDGDLVNIDVVVKHNSYYGDCAATKLLGDPKVHPHRAKLLELTSDCLTHGIAVSRIGNTLSDIGYAINSLINQEGGHNIVSEYSGHGIGKNLHEWPMIQNNFNNDDTPIVEGMLFTIEPIVVNRVNYRLFTDIDKFTIYTANQILSAHFEHTIYISKEGPVRLT